ncbi:MAG: DUF21 domain-containing protein, partial [Saprospiraceae bacterium]|nr:DUF21 domain-containing protein [Saprospiraceae bacterium]
MEILLILFLILLNGFFALCEISLVSAKRAKIEGMLPKGSTRAQMIFTLQEHPERFLSAIQVGITLIGIISG